MNRWIRGWMERREGRKEEKRRMEGVGGRVGERRERRIPLLNVYVPPFLADTNTLYSTLHEVDSLLTENCYMCPLQSVFTYCLICFHLLGTVGGWAKTIKGRLPGRCSFCKERRHQLGGSRLQVQGKGGDQCNSGVLQLALEPPKIPKFCSSPGLC